jgi:pimeloyl-ACP methyl ester carboxylesterase
MPAAAAPQPPVIVLPGILGTAFHDLYPVEPDEVWSAVFQKEYTRIALHPDDVRYEAREPARVMPWNPFGVVYGDLIESLRHELTARADEPTPVFGFGYDWRQDCARSAAQLAPFIDEVLARTALLKHYKAQPPEAVDLVGHSMGGLVIARYLADRQEQDLPSRARRVVTIATPFRGAVDALQTLSSGIGLITGPDSKSREREAGRTIPALYQLLPSYKGAVAMDAALKARVGTDDLFDIRAWQPSILATLAQFILLQDARITARKLLGQHLDGARRLADTVNGLQPELVLPEQAAGWLAIVGTDATTYTRARIVDDGGGRPRFDFPAPANAWPGSDRTGDNTVPFLGAVPDFLQRSQLVCVTTDDLGLLELGDRALLSRVGFHAALPKFNHVQKLTARFLRDDLGWKLKGRKAPGVTRTRWPSWLTAG